jgi:hypothetical protein
VSDITPLNVQRDSIRWLPILKFLAVLALFLFFFISFLLRHVYNYDFWWHLATGKYIMETKSLPQSDPFSYTTHESPTDRKSLILRGYWLAQVIFYQVFRLWDLMGIIVLRSILLLLFLFFVFLTIRKQGSSDFLALILTAGVFVFSKGYMGERPQLFTFLFFSVIFYLLEDFRVNRSRKIFFIPALMLFLSNMHPGYIVCILLISLYLAGQGILAIYKKDSAEGQVKTLFGVWLLTIIVSLFNPNGLLAFTEVFALGKHNRGIVEFMPTFYLYANKLKPLDYSYLIFLSFSLCTLRYFRKITPVQILVLTIFIIMSFIAIRYVIFYMCVAAPIIAGIIMNIKDKKTLKRPFEILKAKEGLLYLITCIAGVALVFQAIPALARYEFTSDTSFSAPKDAADFIEKQAISGNMFNEYGYGGYLMWRLYPKKKVFIDGRTLEPDVYEDYNIIASASTDNNRSWEDILRQYNVTYVITPPLLSRGEMYPIVDALLEKVDWALIYSDHLSLVFLKNNAENISIIRAYSKDKMEGFNTIIFQASAGAMKNKANPYYMITLGKVFYKTGKMSDAQKAFEMAYQRDPKNPIITEWLRKVRSDK